MIPCIVHVQFSLTSCVSIKQAYHSTNAIQFPATG